MECNKTSQFFHKAEPVAPSPWGEGRGEGDNALLTEWSQKIITALQQLNLRAQLGIAATPNISLLAARAAKPMLVVDRVDVFFQSLPLPALEPPPHLLHILQRWGIHTAGAFLALGKDAIADRLGAEALELFERASTHTIRPLNIVRPTDTFEERSEFEVQIETIEPLLFVLRRFIEQLATRIGLTYRVVAELRLTLTLESGASYKRTFKVPAPTANVETLFRMLHTHLENLQTDAPLLSLRLAAVPVRAEGQQFSLFESALRDPNHFHETLARLSALLGNERAGTPIAQNTHQPDAFRMEVPAFHTAQASETESIGQNSKRFGLCLRRFRPALHTRVLLKEDRPAHIEALPHGRVKQARGPFRTSGKWWVQKQGWLRQEWDVELASGELYRLCESQGEWTVEGVYDAHAVHTSQEPGNAPELLIKSKPSNYVEFHCRTAFSFLRGGSRPEELIALAAKNDLSTVAVCDRDGVYGSPLFSAEAKEKGIRPIVGAEITLEDESVLPVLVQSRQGYQNLCQLLTRAHLRAEKGRPRVCWDELPEFSEGLVALTGDEEGPLVKAVNKSFANTFLPKQVLKNLTRAFGSENVFVELQRHRLRGEQRLNDSLIQLAQHGRLPVLATNGVLYAHSGRRAVMDVFTCLRHHTHLDAAGLLLARNSERYLKSPKDMCELFHDLPEAIDNTVRLAERLEFSLENLGYEFPNYKTPNGEPMEAFLKQVTYEGARLRYPKGIPQNVQAKLKQELNLINEARVRGLFPHRLGHR